MNGQLSQAAQFMQGALQGDDGSFAGVSTDTRSLQPGELFVALRGPNFDGHDYVAKARACGAVAAVVDRRVDDSIAQIEVDDTTLALGRLGTAWRQHTNPKVVGITGSNGKTTLKELVAACLAQSAQTFATRGNFNNDIGVPLMLLEISGDDAFAVIEMGANHAGEIAYLASLAAPDVVAITNAAAAHLEGFGSVEGVAHAKGEILQNAVRPSTAVLNADDDYFAFWQSLAGDVQIVSFGLSASAAVNGDRIRSDAVGSTFRLNTPTGSVDVELPLPGTHNVRNACAAAAIALSLDVPLAAIKAGLETAVPVAGRLAPQPGINGCALFDDSYNANPLSVIAAAEFIAGLPGESWLVLGDMYELGAGARALHREVGAAARANGVTRLLALGDLSFDAVEAFGTGATWFDDIDKLVAAAAEAHDGVNILVKGSRGMRMERVVDALRATDQVREA